MSGLVAIHQPNFFPWLGYFDKIRRADVFVFLDMVDYPRAGSGGMGSWTNRVRIDVQGTPRWITCPIRRLPLGASIMDAQIDDSQNWRTKLRKTLSACYGRAPGYSRTMDVIDGHLERREPSLAEFNIGVIKRIATELGLSTRFIRQSAITHGGRGTDLLISLVKAVGGHAYLAGSGAGGYQQDALFNDHGVELVYQGFQPTPYGEPDRFFPGLSVIDYLMRDGRPIGSENEHER